MITSLASAVLAVVVGLPVSHAQTAMAGRILHRNAVYQIENGSGTPVVQINHRSELAVKQYQQTTTVFETGSGDSYTMRYLRRERPEYTEASLEFPDRQKIVFEAWENVRVTDLSTGKKRLGSRDSHFKRGGRTFSFDLSKPFKPQFESKEGKVFRESLPSEAIELMQALWETRQELCQRAALCAVPALFVHLYLGEEDEELAGPGKKGWQLVTIRESHKAEATDGDVPVSTHKEKN
jgi:hypothetical protein